MMRHAEIKVTYTLLIPVDKSLSEAEDRVYDKFPDIEDLEAITGVIVKEASLVIKLDDGLQVIGA